MLGRTVNPVVFSNEGCFLHPFVQEECIGQVLLHQTQPSWSSSSLLSLQDTLLYITNLDQSSFLLLLLSPIFCLCPTSGFFWLPSFLLSSLLYPILSFHSCLSHVPVIWHPIPAEHMKLMAADSYLKANQKFPIKDRLVTGEPQEQCLLQGQSHRTESQISHVEGPSLALKTLRINRQKTVSISASQHVYSSASLFSHIHSVCLSDTLPRAILQKERDADA